MTTGKQGADPPPVVIFDEVILPVEAADGWLQRWRADYLPGALRRGLRLEGAWRGFTEDPARATVLIQWSVPAVELFFATRGPAVADPDVAEFWDATDRLAVTRSRRVLGDAGVTP